jgi:hypothetical protein
MYVMAHVSRGARGPFGPHSPQWHFYFNAICFKFAALASNFCQMLIFKKYRNADKPVFLKYQ